MSKKQRESVAKRSKPYGKPTLTKEKQLREITAGDVPMSRPEPLG